jgi:VWFA-related protein
VRLLKVVGGVLAAGVLSAGVCLGQTPGSTTAGQAGGDDAVRGQAPAGVGSAPMRMSFVASGGGADGLSSADVKLLDNKATAQIASLRQLPASGASTHVILVIDDVNAPLLTVAYERSELKKFFARNEGQLRAPFTIAVLTDSKLDVQQGASQNGAEEDALLQKYQVGLHEIPRGAQYGGLDRTNIGLSGLQQIVAYAARIPGHKLILFVSPGWPLLSGPRIDLPMREQNAIYQRVARLQDVMLQSEITLDMLNPYGPAESLLRENYYQSFVKGVTKPGDAQIADLSLQVLAVHSGGVVVQGTSDIDGMVDRALGDMDHLYEATFVPGTTDRPNEYHALHLDVNRPGVKVRMPDEYYAHVVDDGETLR